MNNNEIIKPWGSYIVLYEEPNIKLKKLIVIPGGKLSLQSHNHRSEYWTFINGIGKLYLNNEEIIKKRDDTCFIGKQIKHRAENIGDEDLVIIEIQTGDIVDEDDIIRYDDIYGRI